MTAAELIDAFIERVFGSLDETIEETHRLMGAAVPALDVVARPELAATAEACSRASLDLVLEAMRHGSTPRTVPPEAIAEARLCARLGVPVDDLLQTYRVTHEQMWSVAIDVVERAQAPPEERAEALRAVARALYSFLDLVSAALPEAYRGVGKAMAERTVTAVRRVLEDGREQLDGLAYDLRGEHVGSVAWGPGAGAAATALAGGADGAHALVVTVSDETAWVWMRPGGAPLEPPPGVRLAVGMPGRGAGGFRRSHAEAVRAQAVAAHTGATVTRYADVAIEWLAVTDLAAARAFVAAEIGPLLGGGVRGARLRATVAAFLANGQSQAATAAALGVADRTIAYRVRTAEERLGHPVYARAAELAIALRWAALLEPTLPISAKSPLRERGSRRAREGAR